MGNFLCVWRIFGLVRGKHIFVTGNWANILLMRRPRLLKCHFENIKGGVWLGMVMFHYHFPFSACFQLSPGVQ